MSFTLVYWGGMQKFLGRGWAPMMILEEAGATYECKTPEDKPPVTFAPPMIITPCGVQVSQVAVIGMALGKELNMWPTGANELKAMQLCCDSADMLSDGFAKKGEERMDKWCAHLEAQLELSEGPFMFGSSLTAADYVIYAGLAMCSSLGDEAGATSITKCPKLTAFMDEIKKCKGYLAVEAKGLPVMP